jgi:hypothetical protein
MDDRSQEQAGHVDVPPRVVSDAGVAALRCAVQAQLQARHALPAARWRHALRLLCEEARRCGLGPEHVLVTLKEAVHRACDAADLRAGRERAALTSRLVTLCIEEYFGGAPTARTATRRTALHGEFEVAP